MWICAREVRVELDKPTAWHFEDAVSEVLYIRTGNDDAGIHTKQHDHRCMGLGFGVVVMVVCTRGRCGDVTKLSGPATAVNNLELTGVRASRR